MPYTPFIPNTEQWTNFFLHQVQKRRNGRDSPKQADGPIGGGIATQDESVRLTPVGHAHPQVKGHGPEQAVTVKITSPVDSALDQAADQLKHIKANKELAQVIRDFGVKRKASRQKRQTKGKKGRAGKTRQKNHRGKKDVFSKT